MGEGVENPEGTTEYPMRAIGNNHAFALMERGCCPVSPSRLIGRARLGRRHGERDLNSVSGHGQRFASHQFDCWPVLVEKVRCVVEIARLHSKLGFSAGAVRYLKVKIEADGFRLLFDRLIIATHVVSPPFCVAHCTLMTWIFVGPDYGASCQKLRRAWGLTRLKYPRVTPLRLDALADSAESANALGAKPGVPGCLVPSHLLPGPISKVATAAAAN
jgi:hypothetical protein